MLFQTPVNSMTVSDQGGGGGAGQRDQACDPRHSPRHILISSHTWSAKARSEGLRPLLEKKEKLAYVRM